MIIKCTSCSRKFVVKDIDIPDAGRMVQCGYCSVTWHQMPSTQTLKLSKKSLVNDFSEEYNEGPSVDRIKASDGKTYKFLGSQWAQLLPSGKTGLFAKKKIGKELDSLTGRETKNSIKSGIGYDLGHVNLDVWTVEKRLDITACTKATSPPTCDSDSKLIVTLYLE